MKYKWKKEEKTNPPRSYSCSYRSQGVLQYMYSTKDFFLKVFLRESLTISRTVIQVLV